MHDQVAGDLMEKVRAIADVVCHEGLHDFPSEETGGDLCRASLCGLSVFLQDGRPVRIKTQDLDIACEHARLLPANDVSAPGNRLIQLHAGKVSFLRGDAGTLALWHTRICGLQRFFAARRSLKAA
jgi:hypothetical protein